ncbi:MAG TPA: LOG family protein [Anaerolineaceae bacterium]
MRVTIFGGAQPKPGEDAYQDAYRLGQMLGKDGHTILTGGYIGTMEAASRGAREAGGHVIGVTCEDIEQWRKVTPNAYIVEQLRFPTLNERLTALVFNCDAAIALPGGVGTLVEIALYWNNLIIESFPPRPLILVGEGWKQTIEQFLEMLGGYIPEKDQRRLTFAATVDDAYQHLRSYLASANSAA